MTSLEESLMIERVINGETEAFEALVIENQKKVYNLALKMVGDENDALDLSQDAFIKAFRGLDNFRSDCRFSVWLYRLTYNVCIDHLRKKRRLNQTSLTVTDEDGQTSEMEISDVRYSPDQVSERMEIRQAIESGLHELSPEHREIFIMREISGMTYGEIAQTLQISEGTVKSRLARARMYLAKILSKNGTFLDSHRQNKGKEVNLHDEL